MNGMSSEKKLLIFSAPSGSGKTTIVNYLLKQGLPLEFSISATSRAPRGEEVNGKHYHFLSVEDFKNRINSEEFVEWEEVYTDTFYGTLKSELERIWNNGKHVVFDVDVVGGVNLKKLFGSQAMSVFIQAPSVDELRKRLTGRGTDSEEVIAKRIEKAEFEMGFAKEFDHLVVNDILQNACDKVLEKVQNFIEQ